MKEWMLIYRVRGYSWRLGSLYESIVEVFMSILGVSGVAIGIGSLLEILPKELDPAAKGLRGYAILLPIGLGALLAWSGLSGTWGFIRDMIWPAARKGTVSK